MTALFWQEVLSELRCGAPVGLVLVVRNTRHSPGTRGARLFVTSTGRTVGTIGGGVMEHNAVTQLREMLRSATPTAPRLETLTHRRGGGVGSPSGLICAGEQTHVSWILTPAQCPVIEEVVAIQAADGTGRLCFDGQRLWVEPETPGTQQARVRLVKQPAGSAWRYEEQLLEPRRVAILGGGHCAHALSRVLATLNMVVTVVESRSDVPTFTTNPWARHKRVVSDFAEAAAHLDHPALTCVVVMTASYPTDVSALRGLAGRGFPFVGVMGSVAKLQQIRGELQASGVAATEIDRWHAPVGLPIASHTPEEIAMSVTAQLLAERPRLFPALENPEEND